MIQKLPTHLRSIFLLIGSFLTMLQATSAQGVAINTDNTDPDASAALDVKSTSKGVLVPRMTQAQRNAITTPATGLMIFQTDNTPGFYYYTGSAWSAVGGSSSGGSLQLVASNTTTQTIAGSSTVTVSFASVSVAPTLGTWSNTQFTASSAGVYMVTAHIAEITNSIHVVPSIVQAGSTSVAVSGVSVANTSLPAPFSRGFVQGVFSMAANDVIAIRASNTNVSTQTFTSDGSMRLTIVKLF